MTAFYFRSKAIDRKTLLRGDSLAATVSQWGRAGGWGDPWQPSPRPPEVLGFPAEAAALPAHVIRVCLRGAGAAHGPPREPWALHLLRVWLAGLAGLPGLSGLQNRWPLPLAVGGA